jgi:hypothetical protein
MNCYAGIGSRKTPIPVCERMIGIATVLAIKGWVLRTGGAERADESFMKGAMRVLDGKVELYLPWKKFNGWWWGQEGPSEKAIEIAQKYHPNWPKLTNKVRPLIARNTHQVLGADCESPVKFIVCYTEDGQASGGTGQALRIAADYGIKVFNLHNITVTERVIFEYAERCLTGET